MLAHQAPVHKEIVAVDGSAGEIRLAEIEGSLEVLAVAGDFRQGRMINWRIAAVVDPAEVYGVTEGFAPWHQGVFGELGHLVR